MLRHWRNAPRCQNAGWRSHSRAAAVRAERRATRRARAPCSQNCRTDRRTASWRAATARFARSLRAERVRCMRAFARNVRSSRLPTRRTASCRPLAVAHCRDALSAHRRKSARARARSVAARAAGTRRASAAIAFWSPEQRARARRPSRCVHLASAFLAIWSATAATCVAQRHALRSAVTRRRVRARVWSATARSQRLRSMAPLHRANAVRRAMERERPRAPRSSAAEARVRAPSRSQRASARVPAR